MTHAVRRAALPPAETVAQAILNWSTYTAWRDAMFFLWAICRFDGTLRFAETRESPRFRIGVKNHLSVQMTRRTAGGLDKARCRAQKPLLVSVENGDERTSGKVQPPSQKVDAHQYIKFTLAQRAQNLHPLDRSNVTCR
ncbi:MAG: hypothetical protein Ct9H300mP7_4780 [Verrucomicrobiota bacterium]|nr:MAG: hypothetical protein Ct9H300mP7_4780 [Verrucomicrobiota bacterium]